VSEKEKKSWIDWDNEDNKERKETM